MPKVFRSLFRIDRLRRHIRFYFRFIAPRVLMRKMTKQHQRKEIKVWLRQPCLKDAMYPLLAKAKLQLGVSRCPSGFQALELS